MMIRYEKLASASEAMRETMAAIVAGFTADGFTDREARRLAVAFIAPPDTDGADGGD